MNRSLQEYLRCIINGNDKRYTEWSTDVKLIPLSDNSQITTTLGLSPYEFVFNQKPRKPIMFTGNSSKNAQGYCQPTKESICYNLRVYVTIYVTIRSFSSSNNLKISIRNTYRVDFKQRQNTQWNLQESNKKLLQKKNFNSKKNSRFTPATNLKIGTYVLIPNFTTQKIISKNLQLLKKGPY